METLELQLTLQSDALIASGEGFGAIIDSDILFDDVGLPYIPAKRLKGCLHDCACKAQQMLKDCGIPEGISADLVFGKSGQKTPAPVYFSDLHIKEYEANHEWLAYLQQKQLNLNGISQLNLQLLLQTGFFP